jgi:DNA-binding Lrp family transcriptional regulator
MHEVPPLDHFDLRLLAALQENGRLTNQEVADGVRLSASQCSRRRAALEAAGVISGYRAELAAAALGFQLIVFI